MLDKRISIPSKGHNKIELGTWPSVYRVCITKDLDFVKTFLFVNQIVGSFASNLKKEEGKLIDCYCFEIN